MRVSIGPAENGLEVEIVGEIVKMVELGIENKAKRAALDETMTRSVKVVAEDMQPPRINSAAHNDLTTIRSNRGLNSGFVCSPTL